MRVLGDQSRGEVCEITARLPGPQPMGEAAVGGPSASGWLAGSGVPCGKEREGVRVQSLVSNRLQRAAPLPPAIGFRRAREAAGARAGAGVPRRPRASSSSSPPLAPSPPGRAPPLAGMSVEAPGESPAGGRRRRGCRRARLMCMLALTFLFFVLEVVVSRLTASLAMLSDSFHMLSDVMALVVALVAVRFAQRTRATKKNTFGWVRAEVMGALVNAVFLTALCFTILLEAIERFTEPHEIQQPLVVIGVGAAGLLVNVLGLCLFHQHGAGHGHGHSHGGAGGGGGGSRRGKAEAAAGDLLKEETNTLVENCSSSNGLSLEKLGETPREGRRGRRHLSAGGDLSGERPGPFRSQMRVGGGGRAAFWYPTFHAFGPDTGKCDRSP